MTWPARLIFWQIEDQAIFAISNEIIDLLSIPEISDVFPWITFSDNFKLSFYVFLFLSSVDETSAFH